jgi:hypothetical protein
LNDAKLFFHRVALGVLSAACDQLSPVLIPAVNRSSRVYSKALRVSRRRHELEGPRVRTRPSLCVASLERYHET